MHSSIAIIIILGTVGQTSSIYHLQVVSQAAIINCSGLRKATNMELRHALMADVISRDRVERAGI